MANLKSTKPKSKYYIYKSDGCIINITSKKPTDSEMDTDGGYFYPYFENDYFNKPVGTSDRKKVFVKNTTVKTKENIDLFTTGTYFTATGKTAMTPDEKNKAEVSHGVITALPYCKSEEKTYYFDFLISNGDTYTNGKFTSMNRLSTKEQDTYGTLLKSEVKNGLTLNNFINNVSDLPDCLKGDTSAQFNNIKTSDYDLTSEDFAIFGNIYCQLLMDYMKKQGETYITSAKNYISGNDKYTDLIISIDYEKSTIKLQAKENENLIAVSSIVLQDSKGTLSNGNRNIPLTVGQKETLTATVLPSDATNKAVLWKSSNTPVATVTPVLNTPQCTITPKAAGTTLITCVSDSNKNVYETCTITVTASSASTPKLPIIIDDDGSTEELTVGEEYQKEVQLTSTDFLLELPMTQLVTDDNDGETVTTTILLWNDITNQWQPLDVRFLQVEGLSKTVNGKEVSYIKITPSTLWSNEGAKLKIVLTVA